ncbi:beta-ketoacyl synthase N-terminal-like domain-containing protein [Kutzneria buriramensis]|uniref:Acyl transferase domain-containing protein n=1 Tax=Kutzneria buriramensis TaxID=1045776 RepID=A0A3E0I929_9PSEU|nr:beta-ketoacyl synthase N-terminal-like domain-containing protein [Kutzneria buriramensis]REH55258.1 acyl transferase domain-containing protein [Kutzneria buriramensis]
MPDVAIVGMSVLLPGAPDLQTYWRNLVTGVDAITDVPEHRWDPAYYDPAGSARADRLYCRRGGFVDEYADVDPTRFGIMPNSVAGAEPDQLIAMRVAASAIADAGGDDRMPARDRIGVILGRGGYLTPGVVRLDQRVRTAVQLVRTLGELVPGIGDAELERVRAAFTEQLGPEQPESAIGLVPNLAASRVANRLDLRGPAYTVDAACASSLIAVDHAVHELTSGRCDVVLAGGVHHCHDITFWSVFTQLRALSTSQRIRPFHRDADGILIGEGTGVVVLKRLADAERDGDRIYAVVRGTGVASDGRSASLFNPDPGGQVLAVRKAWAAAGLDPSEDGSVGLLEAHGTATPAGDAAELSTLATVFGGPKRRHAVIGSVKSMIGHTMPAAGIAGLVKAALAVHHGVLLPTLHCDDPNPALAATRFRPIDTAEAWTDTVRRAGVNAFGFGGINAHVVLEQAPAPKPAPATITVTEPAKVLRIAANTPDELLRRLKDGRNHEVGRLRLAIVEPTPKKTALAEKVIAKGVPWRGRSNVWFSPEPLLRGNAGIAFVFPGLEADFDPRVDDVADHFGLIRRTVGNGDLGRHGMSVLGVGRLLDGALRRMGIVPTALAGHSIGEWTAMSVSGMFSDRAVEDQLAAFDPTSVEVPGVEFATIGCGVDRVAAAIADRPDIVLSHDNSPNQTIVCGPPDEIAELVAEFRKGAVISQVLPFRSGFHTPMLKPFLEPFVELADRLDMGRPALPIWSATTASPYPTDPDGIRDLYIRHLIEPVRFRATVRAMHESGIRVFVQVGAGQLGSLIDDTLKGADHLTVAANSTHRGGVEQLRLVAAALWVEGASPDFSVVEPTRQPVTLQLGSPLVSVDTTISTGPSRLDTLTADFPIAAELEALLRETAESAAQVMAARQRPSVRSLTKRMTISTDVMPFLLDHCFAPQREGWPDLADRRPVVPGTTLIQLMMDAAEEAAPGLKAVRVHDVKLLRWLIGAPATDVTITAEPIGPDRVRVAVGDHSQATVELTPDWAPRPQSAWSVAASARSTPDMTAREFYERRVMFHGPALQGITALTSVGTHHVSGVITTPDVPGGLLDNVGQLLGYWIWVTQTEKRIAFPVQMGRIEFFGPHPAPGTPVDCLIKVVDVSERLYQVDAQLTVNGVVWAEITDWRDRRFDSHMDLDEAWRFPERNALSQRQPGGWVAVAERWPDLASRELYLSKYLSGRERACYDQLPPRNRRHWLLGRIAVKDAVRNLLWDNGSGPVFPAEVLVSDTADGRVTVAGNNGFPLPEVSVSLAHKDELGVAIARFGRAPVSIAIDAPSTDGRRRAVVSNPADLPARQYVVAWTAGPADQEDE